MLSVIIFLIVLALLIFVHELGHFVVAKKTGMRVDEFAIGFPPTIFSVKKGETKYSINAIPFGGFVKILGEDPDENSILALEDKRSFTNRPRSAQAAVLVAGVVFNILFAWILISAGLTYGMPMPTKGFESDDIRERNIVISNVLVDSPASKAGLMAGDKILFIGSDTNGLQQSNVSDIQNFISSNSGKKINILYKRGEDVRTVFVTPIEGIVKDKSAIGISMEDIALVQMPFYEAVWEGLRITIDMTIDTIKGLTLFIARIFMGKADLSSVSGPIGIAGMIGDAANLGFIYLLTFTAFISINLAVINLIPFPALDGGRLLFVIIEGIKGSIIKPKITNSLNVIGFLLLIALMIAVSYNDIVRLF